MKIQKLDIIENIQENLINVLNNTMIDTGNYYIILIGKPNLAITPIKNQINKK